jgi:hypothetical protein
VRPNSTSTALVWFGRCSAEDSGKFHFSFDIFGVLLPGDEKARRDRLKTSSLAAPIDRLQRRHDSLPDRNKRILSTSSLTLRKAMHQTFTRTSRPNSSRSFRTGLCARETQVEREQQILPYTNYLGNSR